jgi:nicotinamide mononucleotide transporter
LTITGNKSLDALIESLVFAFVATAVSYGVAIYAGWISAASLLEITCLFTAYSCTYMCVKQTRWNYPMGILNVGLLAWYFADLKLYGLMATNLYLLPWLFYGWFRWRSDDDPRPVTYVINDAPIWWAAYIIAAVTAFFAMRYINEQLGGSLAWQDSAIFAATVIAQFWLDNKKRETWIVWVLVNIISMYVFLQTDQPLFFVQYLFFLANTVYGWFSWPAKTEPKLAAAE